MQGRKFRRQLTNRCANRCNSAHLLDQVAAFWGVHEIGVPNAGGDLLRRHAPPTGPCVSRSFLMEDYTVLLGLEYSVLLPFIGGSISGILGFWNGVVRNSHKAAVVWMSISVALLILGSLIGHGLSY